MDYQNAFEYSVIINHRCWTITGNIYMAYFVMLLKDNLWFCVCLGVTIFFYIWIICFKILITNISSIPVSKYFIIPTLCVYACCDDRKIKRGKALSLYKGRQCQFLCIPLFPLHCIASICFALHCELYCPILFCTVLHCIKCCIAY